MIVIRALASVTGSSDAMWSGRHVGLPALAPTAADSRDDSLPLLALSTQERNATAPVTMAMYGGGEMAKFSAFGFFGALSQHVTPWDIITFTSGAQLAATSVLHGSMEGILARNENNFKKLLHRHAADVLQNFEMHEAAAPSSFDGCSGFYRLGRNAFTIAKRMFSRRMHVPGVHGLIHWLERKYIAHLANELDAAPMCVSRAFLSGAESTGNYMFNVTKFANVVLPGVRPNEVLTRTFRGADVHYAFKMYAHWHDEELRHVRSERTIQQIVSGSAYGHFHGDRAFLMNPPDALVTNGHRIPINRFITRPLSVMDSLVHGISCFSFVPLVLAESVAQRTLTDAMQKSERVHLNGATTMTIPLVDTGTVNAETAEALTRSRRDPWASTISIVQVIALAVLIDAALRRSRSSAGESVPGEDTRSSPLAHANAVLTATVARDARSSPMTRPSENRHTTALSVERARRRQAAVAALVLAATTGASWFARTSGHASMTEGDCSTLLLSIGLAAQKHPTVVERAGVVVGVSQYGTNGIDSLVQKGIVTEEWTALRESGNVKLQIIRAIASIPDFQIQQNLRACIVWTYPGCDSSPLKLQAFSTADYRTKIESYVTCAERTRRIWRTVHKAAYFEECRRALRRS